jgi:hypothetical protein
MTLESTTLATARAERDDYKALIKKGIDPKVERTLQKERLRIQQIEEQNALNRLALRITVYDLFTRWFEMDLINRKDKIEIDRMFKKDVLPILGEIFVEEVRKGHVVHVIDLLKQRGVAHLARNILKLMRQMFKFAVNRDLIEFDPTASLSIAKMTTTPTERDRILDESEIISLAHQLPSANLLKSTECALWIALSTMCRIGEYPKQKLPILILICIPGLFLKKTVKMVKHIPFTYRILHSINLKFSYNTQKTTHGYLQIAMAQIMFVKNQLQNN